MSKQSTESKRPTHGIYQVQGEGQKGRWNRVGAAWLHKDSKGANLVFDAFPLSGRVVVRELTEKEETGEADATATEGAE